MRYYVIAPDGQRYGPADIDTLNAWITEGRVSQTQLLEEEGTGTRVAASAIQGLVFPEAPAEPAVPGPGGQSFAGGQPYQNYYPRGGPGAPGVPFDDGKQDVTYAWVFGGVSILLMCVCGFLSTPVAGLGLYFASRAKKKGSPQAQAPFIFNCVVIGIGVLLLIAGLAMLSLGGLRMPGPRFPR